MDKFLAGFGRCDITPEGLTRINPSWVSNHITQPGFAAISDATGVIPLSTVCFGDVGIAFTP